MTVRPYSTVYRDFETDLVPSSGFHEPIKSDIRDSLNATLTLLKGSNAGAIIQITKAALDALTGIDADTMGWVIGDGANDGVYQLVSSVWTKRAELPYDIISLNNAGAGTANAIVATTAVNVPSAAYAALLILNVTVANTGAVTVAVNGGTAKPLVTNTAAAIPAGYLTAGMATLAVDDGTNYRLLSYGDASAVQAAAEAARDAAVIAQGLAEDAQAAAELAAANAGSDNKPTLALAIADDPDTDPAYYNVLFYDTNYLSGSGAKYKQVGSDPGHAGAFQNANNVWYEINEPYLRPEMLGIIDGTSNDYTTVATAIAVGAAQNIPIRLIREYMMTGQLSLPAGTVIEGETKENSILNFTNDSSLNVRIFAADATGIELRNFSIIDDEGGDQNTNGVTLVGGAPIVENLNITGIKGSAIYFSTTARALIQDCFTSGGSFGITAFKGNTNLRILNNYVNDTDYQGILVDDATAADDATIPPGVNAAANISCHITGNHVNQHSRISGYHGIACSGLITGFIQNNLITNGGTSGSLASGGIVVNSGQSAYNRSSAIYIDGNIIRGNNGNSSSVASIQIQGVNTGTITNNILQDNFVWTSAVAGLSEIEIQNDVTPNGSFGIIIDGNTITQTGSGGRATIGISAASGTLGSRIGANLISGMNTDYDILAAPGGCTFSGITVGSLPTAQVGQFGRHILSTADGDLYVGTAVPSWIRVGTQT